MRSTRTVGPYRNSCAVVPARSERTLFKQWYCEGLRAVDPRRCPAPFTRWHIRKTSFFVTDTTDFASIAHSKKRGAPFS